MQNQLASQSRAHVPASALSIVMLQRPFGPRFLHDENNNGGGAPGAGAAAPGGGAPGDGGAAAAAGAGDGGGQPPAGGAAPSPYRPEGLPDHLFGTSDKETIDKLNTAYVGARKSIGDLGTVPEKADGYTFEASDKLKPYVSNFDKDPVYQKAREFALSSGMSSKTFGAFMPALLEHLVDGGLVAAPIDAKGQLRAMAPASLANATDQEKETAGARRVQDNIAWVDGAKASQAIDADIAEFLSVSAADNPAAIKLIEWLRGANSETMPALGGGGGSGLSDDQLTARMNDPRNDPRSSKFEKSFAEETDAMSKKHYGG